MQRADFICDICGHTREVEFEAGKAPKEAMCEKCEGTMRRVFAAAVTIPEWFADDTHNAIAKHMENAPRPSGRDKALY